MARWHHGLNGHEFEQGVGVGDEQGSLACCSPWGHEELDTPEQLNGKKKKNPQTIDPCPRHVFLELKSPYIVTSQSKLLLVLQLSESYASQCSAMCLLHPLCGP